MSFQKEFNYHKLSYDLSTARTGQLVPLQGNIICVLNTSSKNCNLKIKFWREYSEYLELVYGGNLVVPFKEFYLSNDVQVGEHIDLLIVKGISWEEFKVSGGLGFDAVPDIDQVEIQNGIRPLHYAVIPNTEVEIGESYFFNLDKVFYNAILYLYCETAFYLKKLWVQHSEMLGYHIWRWPVVLNSAGTFRFPIAEDFYGLAIPLPYIFNKIGFIPLFVPDESFVKGYVVGDKILRDIPL